MVICFVLDLKKSVYLHYVDISQHKFDRQLVDPQLHAGVSTVQGSVKTTLKALLYRSLNRSELTSQLSKLCCSQTFDKNPSEFTGNSVLITEVLDSIFDDFFDLCREFSGYFH